MIRLGEKKDIPEVSRLGRQFFNESGYSKISKYDEKSVENYLSQFYELGLLILIVAEEEGKIIGMTGALLFPLYLNKDILMAQELFWWVHPEKRGKIGGEILSALEAEVQHKGVRSLIMIALENIQPERVGKMYEKRGYFKIENHWMKVFNGD